MKLKTLLLGSAAAMIAFTGARAADAVIAEPEPVDYVKVCDVYGAGFFFIPGTETCLKLSGYVDVQYEYTDRNNGRNSLGEATYTARVNFDARNETDYGTLGSYIRMETGQSAGAQPNFGNNNANVANLNALEAWIDLGGLSMGRRTQDFTYNTFGHNGSIMLDGQYGFQRVMYAQYTYAAAGFTVTGGVQLDPSFNNDAGDFGNLSDAELLALGIPQAQIDARTAGIGANNSAAKSVDPYARIGYAGGMFGVQARLGYDTSVDALAYAVKVEVNPIDGFQVWGWYEGEDDGDLGTGGTFVGNDNNWGIGASYKFADSITLAAGYDFAESHANVDTEQYVVGIRWDIAPGLQMRANYRHSETDVVGGADNDQDEFRVRFRRSF